MLRSRATSGVRRWRLLLGVVVSIGTLVFSMTPPADGVVDGLPDGNQHPNVGLIVGLDDRGFGVYSCTGMLVDPTTVLTAAHCVGGQDFATAIASIVIDFDPQLTRLPSGNYLIERYVQGTGDPHPNYRNVGGSTSSFLADSAYDIGLMHLTAPAATVFPGIQPTPIAAAGTNEQYRTGPKKELLLQIGYGQKRDGPPGQSTSFFIDYTRNQSSVEPRKVTDALLLMGANPNNAIGYGSPCSGDSGSPVLRDGVVVSIIAFVQGNCQNLVGGPRLDAGPARDFLLSRGIH